MRTYSPRVLELFHALPGSGPLPPGSGETLAGEAGDLAAGAWVRIEARVLYGRIAAARFEAWGCPHTLAAAAWVAGHLPGLAPAEAPGVARPREVAARLDVPAGKLGRLLKVEEAVRGLAEAHVADQKR